jgi:hypothetical protein
MGSGVLLLDGGSLFTGVVDELDVLVVVVAAVVDVSSELIEFANR